MNVGEVNTILSVILEKKKEDEGLDAICGEQEKLCEITSTGDVLTFVWDMQRCSKVGAQHVEKVMLMQRISGSVKELWFYHKKYITVFIW